jgi:hypothetical protein
MVSSDTDAIRARPAKLKPGVSGGSVHDRRETNNARPAVVGRFDHVIPCLMIFCRLLVVVLQLNELVGVAGARRQPSSAGANDGSAKVDKNVCILVERG